MDFKTRHLLHCRDIYGAIGYPLKLARTIIVGKKADLVKKILYVLSYFIRCSDVHESSDHRTLESFLDDIRAESPDEDKTPLHEGFKFPLVPGFQNSNTVIFDNNPTNVQNNNPHNVQNDNPYYVQDDNPHNVQDNNPHNVQNDNPHNVQNAGKIYSDVERNDLKLDLCVSRNESDANRNSCETELSINQDEGYCSIVQSIESEGVRYRLSTDSVVENVPVENVTNVNRAAKPRTSDLNEKHVKPSKPSVLSSNPSCNNCGVNEEKKPSRDEIRQQFLSDRSPSIFNEYFEDDSIQTKTIDDVPVEKRVVQHPAALRDLVTSQSLECLTECPDDAGTHQKRLGSVGQMARPKLPPLSRQMSSDFSKPSTYNPVRCRLDIAPIVNNDPLKFLIVE